MEIYNIHQNKPLQQRISHLKTRISQGDYSQLEGVKCTLAQYRICVGVLSEYFSTIPNQVWEKHGDGIGMCWNNDWEFDNGHIHGSSISNKIEEIKASMLDEIGVSVFDSTIKTCVYHRKGVGCILGDLKSPRCVTEPDGDISEKYNYEKLMNLLNKIQIAGATEEGLFQDESPKENWNVVVEFLEEVESYL